MPDPARPASLQLWDTAGDHRINPPPPGRRIPAWTRTPVADLGGEQPDGDQAGWWWLAVHGGAGVSTLHRWIPGGADAQRRWPDPARGGPGAVLLVCRTHASGLSRARDAARQWAAADVPRGLLLAGVVAIADAPGRLPRPQAETLRLLAGITPRVWTLPWVEELRAVTDPEDLGAPPAPVLDLAHELQALQQPALERTFR